LPDRAQIIYFNALGIIVKFSKMFWCDQFLGLTEFLNTTEIEECDDELSGQNTYNKIIIDIYHKNGENWLQHCPLPCSQKVFDLNYQLFHKNNINGPICRVTGVSFIKHFVIITDKRVKELWCLYLSIFKSSIYLPVS
jgi:hypothetical protein